MNDILTTPVDPVRLVGLDRIQRLTLQEARANAENSQSLFVLNTADTVIDNGGIVYVSIHQKDGEPIAIEVPRTWLATDLCNKAPRESILNSTKFMQSINSGLLTLISDEVANAINSDPSAPAEIARLRQSAEVVKTSQAARTIGRNVSISVGSQSEAQRAAQPMPTLNRANQSHAQTQPQQASLQPKLAQPQVRRAPLFGGTQAAELPKELDMQAHLASLSSFTPEDGAGDGFAEVVATANGMDPRQATEHLQANFPKVSIPKLQYLVENTTHDFIKTWARGVLASMQPSA